MTARPAARLPFPSTGTPGEGWGGGFCGALSHMSETNRQLRDKVRKVFMEDWDPTNASRSEYASGEYDSYIDPMINLLSQGADEEAVIDFLREKERECMCFPGLDTQRLRPVARKLLALKVR